MSVISWGRRSVLAGLVAMAAPELVQAETGQGRVVVPAPGGLVGEVCLPSRKALAPGLLILGGSEGGHATAYRHAELFAGRGYAALGLAYFGERGLPSTLENIPLEYFDRALDWLCSLRGVDAARIGVLGGSKGAEAALLIASRDKRIKGVVAGAPSSVAWQGYNNPTDFMNAGPSWTAHGTPVPFVPYDRSLPFTNVLDLYQRSLMKAPPDAVIPVERINGAVLLVSGKDDRLWPSSAMADAVIARLDRAGFLFRHTHLAYDNAGHEGFGEPIPADAKFSPAMLRLFGGTTEGNIAMRADSWPKILAFLDAVLKPERRASLLSVPETRSGVVVTDAAVLEQQQRNLAERVFLGWRKPLNSANTGRGATS